ncbi:phosphatase PAP2 family protein [Streptomyces sp. NBC_00190]|uniref:phosphatase PAP2 family protein n=1 Tax=unclassified Streptomyces TaxID=2593676 RepID=UPI002E28A462|nr:phosphatase PAP2 family protein [Streptomyces sp. NBC_00190]WSZ38046.1 phosphatase PAP2 family protein [Streptomyces sp. NBC_00868]
MTERSTRPRWHFLARLVSGRAGADARFGVRLVTTSAATAVAAVPFSLALVLVESRWAPLHRLDQGTAERLHRSALGHPAWVRVLDFLTHVVWGPLTMRLLVAAVVVWLVWRRALRLAAWAAVTATVGGLVGLLAKNAVERARPHLPDPVAHAPGFSFPSGHAMTATTSCAVLLLVLLPLVPRAWRPLPWALAAATVLGVCYTRVALGVHWVSDVVGGWLLGLAVVTGTTLAFEAWRGDMGRRRTTPAQGLEPEIVTAAPEAPADVRRG